MTETRDFSPRPLRRLLMTADPLGGIWDHALELCRGLAAHDIQLCLAVLGGPLSADQAAAAQIPGLQVAVWNGRLEWMPDSLEDVVRSGEWLMGLADEFRPDLVHVNGYAHAALPFDAPVVLGAHSCVLSWFRAVKGAAAPPDYGAYAAGVRRGLDCADLVVAPGAAMLDALTLHYGRVPRSRVIPNGIDPARFSPGPKDDLILTVGRLWDEAKNIEALDGIAPQVGSPIAAIGACTGPDGTERRPTHLAAMGRLPRSQLAEWYARASVFALPARYEPFGLAVLEAALSGCALVLGNIPSLRANWEGAALFVPPDDGAALRDALNALVTNAGLRADMAAAARIRARRFNAAAMTEAYLESYALLGSDAARVAA
jgi:glycosyltransferase involved in cell wall biosynthesis